MAPSTFLSEDERRSCETTWKRLEFQVWNLTLQAEALKNLKKAEAIYIHIPKLNSSSRSFEELKESRSQLL